MTGVAWTAGLPEPNTNEIVERSTQETTANWNQTPNYSFVERDAESKHDTEPSVKTYQVFQIDGSPYNRLMAIADDLGPSVARYPGKSAFAAFGVA